MVQTNPNDRLLKFLQASPEVQAEIDRVLEGRSPVPRSEPPTGPLLMGMSAAAKFTGVSRATLWRICRSGRLPKVEILPGSFRIRRADLEALAIPDLFRAAAFTLAVDPASIVELLVAFSEVRPLLLHCRARLAVFGPTIGGSSEVIVLQ